MVNPSESESVSVYFSEPEVEQLLEPFDKEVVGEDGLRSARIKEAMQLLLEYERIAARYPGIELDEHGRRASLRTALNDHFGQ